MRAPSHFRFRPLFVYILHCVHREMSLDDCRRRFLDEFPQGLTLPIVLEDAGSIGDGCMFHLQGSGNGNIPLMRHLSATFDVTNHRTLLACKSVLTLVAVMTTRWSNPDTAAIKASFVTPLLKIPQPRGINSTLDQLHREFHDIIDTHNDTTISGFEPVSKDAWKMQLGMAWFITNYPYAISNTVEGVNMRGHGHQKVITTLSCIRWSEEHGNLTYSSSDPNPGDYAHTIFRPTGTKAHSTYIEDVKEAQKAAARRKRKKNKALEWEQDGELPPGFRCNSKKKCCNLDAAIHRAMEAHFYDREPYRFLEFFACGDRPTHGSVYVCKITGAIPEVRRHHAKITARWTAQEVNECEDMVAFPQYYVGWSESVAPLDVIHTAVKDQRRIDLGYRFESDNEFCECVSQQFDDGESGYACVKCIKLHFVGDSWTPHTVPPFDIVIHT